MLNSVSTMCQHYYNEMPKDTFHKVGRSALFSFTVTLIMANPIICKNPATDFSLKLAQPLLTGCIAGTASLIHALTTPLFNAIFGDNKVLLHREIVKWGVNVTCVYLLLDRISPIKTHLFFLTFQSTIPVNMIKTLFNLEFDFMDWVDQSTGATGAPNFLRNILRSIGIDFAPDPDANSAYYTYIPLNLLAP